MMLKWYTDEINVQVKKSALPIDWIPWEVGGYEMTFLSKKSMDL